MKRSFVIILSLLLLTGCALAITRGFAIDHKRHDYYPATKFDLVCMYETSRALRLDLMAAFLLCLIDTPISLTIDTICFPYDIYDFYNAQKIEERSKDTHVSQQKKGNNKIDKLKHNNNTEKDSIHMSKNNIGSPDENINSKPDNASTSQSLQSTNPGKEMSAAEVEQAVPSNLPVSSSTPAGSHEPERLSVKLGDTIDNVRSAYHTSAKPEPVKSTTPDATCLRLKDTGIWFFF